MRIANKPMWSLTGLLVLATTATSITAQADRNSPFSYLKRKKKNDHSTSAETPSGTRAAPPSNKDKEEAIFEAFAADFARFYSCQAEDTEWYLKRFFEQLKFSIVSNPDIREITMKPSEITSMMKKHLKSNNPTSTKYLNQISDFSIEISEHLLEARTRKPAPNWNNRLGGNRGLLATTGLDSGRKKWDTLFTTSLPSPLLRLRHCKEPLKATDRAAANEVTTAKSGYRQAAAAPSANVDSPRPSKPNFFERRRLAREARKTRETQVAAEHVASKRVNTTTTRTVAKTPTSVKSPRENFWQRLTKSKKKEKAAPAPSVTARPVVQAPVPQTPPPRAPTTNTASRSTSAPAPATGPLYTGAGATNSFIKTRIADLQAELKRAEGQGQTKVASEIRLQLKKLQEDLARAQ